MGKRKLTKRGRPLTAEDREWAERIGVDPKDLQAWKNLLSLSPEERRKAYEERPELREKRCEIIGRSEADMRRRGAISGPAHLPDWAAFYYHIHDAWWRLNPSYTDDPDALPRYNDLIQHLVVQHNMRPSQAAELSAWDIAKLLKADADAAERPRAEPADTGYCVTLQQAAPLVGKSKRTLERWAKDDQFPLPEVQGTGGTASYWRWSVLRVYLQTRTGLALPERHPADPSRPDYGRLDCPSTADI